MAIDFSDSLHPAVAAYRKRLADQGLFDDQDDYQIVRFLAQKNPTLLEQDPTFGQLYGEIREANAPGLGEEFGRAAKRATIGLGATALGGGALVTGSDYLKRKAAALQMQASDPDLAPTIATLEDIRPGQDGIGQAFSRDALRYGISKVGEVVPSAAEAAVTAGIGAAVGSSAGPGGTLAGAAGGFLGRATIKKAIRKLVTKDLTEEVIERGLREAVPEIVEAVTKNAANIAKVGGATAASAVNSYILNAGEVYNENDDRGTAAVLGAVSAIPDTVLPALVVRKLFPGVSLSAGRAAAKELVGNNAVKVAKAAGVAGFEAGTEAFQESVNIVARNLKEGRDPLSFDDADLIRVREAGITGAVGGGLAAPAVVLGRDGDVVAPQPVAPPVAPPAPVVAPVPVIAPPVASATLPTQRVRAMSPEQQVVRLAELETRSRTPDEEAEYQILLQAVPRQARTPITPEVVEAVAGGNLPLAPTAVEEAPVTPISPTIDTPLQEPAGVAGSAPNLGSGVETVSASAINVTQQVAAMDGPAFMSWAQQQEGGFTTKALETGIQAIGNPAAIDALKAARTQAEQQFTAARQAMRSGDTAAADDASALTGKVQFFSEAIGAAENTGSAATAPEVKAAHAQLSTPIPNAPVAAPFVAPTMPTAAPLESPAPVAAVSGQAPAFAFPAEAAPVAPVLTQQGEPSALQIRQAEEIFQSPSQETGEAGGERGGVEPIFQGAAPPGTVAPVTLPTPQGGEQIFGGLAPEQPIIPTQAPLAEVVPIRQSWLDRELNRAAAMPDLEKTNPDLARRIGLGVATPQEIAAASSGIPEATPLPPSREQRLNDAGIDLPPISSMSRAAKRAELDAAGVTTYNGKPLDEANPAQISAAVGKLRRGELGNEPAPAPRTSTQPTNPAVNAERTKQFQAVMGRMVSNGANVQAMSQELLAQQTGEVLQQQIAALEQRLQQAQTAPQRNELTKAIAIRQERLAEVQQMQGVTFDPYHIAIAMDDVMNANVDNLVTLIHEAAESLTMRLTPAQQGAVFRGVEKATAQMQAKMQEAAKLTGATVASVPVPSELLAETLAQTLAAEGIQDAPSLAQLIVRWLKEIYYRVAMAAQRAFGGEPNPETALNWYENQLRRELGGDYEYAFARILDRLLPPQNATIAAKFSGATGTPGGMIDFFDPTTQRTQQPWVQPTSDAALAWNMKFRSTEPTEDSDIPAEEAVNRQTAAAYNDQIKWLNELQTQIAPTMPPADFVGLLSPGQKSPHEMLEVLKTQYPGIETAEIGGERMTDPMNKWASWQVLKYMKDTQSRVLKFIASTQESVKEADEAFTEHARELNRLEPDVRNAELHEAELKTRAKKIIERTLRSFGSGIRKASKLGEMIRDEENLSEGDPLPQFYQNAFGNLLQGGLPIFEYADAIASLDLPLATMEPQAIWKAIRENADTSPQLRELSRNKPLGLTMAVMARDGARQFDQILLRKSPAKEFLDIKTELDGIRNATEAQLRLMIRALDEKSEAKGLRQRIRAAYLKERRALRRASDRMAVAEERIKVLEAAKEPVAKKIEEAQQAIGGVFSEWTPGDGIEFTVMSQSDVGEWSKTARTLRVNADGSYQDSDGIYSDIASNERWLKANVERAGTKEYERVKYQTRLMELQDISRAYQAHNYVKVIGWIDKFVRPLQAIARQAGHSSGSRIVQQFNKFDFINRSGAKSLTNLSYQWGALQAQVMKSMGISDVGQFMGQIYNPVMFMVGVNKGWDRATAIREATKRARELSPNPPAANFNERFAAFMEKDKENNEELRRTAEDNSVLVWDDKLGEFRKALPRGWITGMRSLNDGTVVTLIHDMERAGWKLEMDDEALKKQKKVVTRAATFDSMNPKKAATAEERAEYYAQLDNTDALRAALQSYFTPGILKDWLLPFINKPGEAVFTHDGRDISQLDLQNAWAESGGDLVTWIDKLGQRIGVTPEEGVSESATFRWDMLNQIDRLFGWEAKMAYEAEQTPDLFSANGTKLHVMMDARVNDLLPDEHVTFRGYDPVSAKQLLGQIAFHGAFGRNGSALQANINELFAVSSAKKHAFDSLRSTTVEGKKREAAEKGLNYDELKRAVGHYQDVLELKGELDAAFGVNNIYGPLHDARAGLELLNFMTGQLVDQPKVGALNFLSLGARPFAQHSFSPKVLKATAVAYKELGKNAFGDMLRDFGIDLIRKSEYAKETGEVEGRAFRRLPWATVLMGDSGKEGSYQDSLASRFLIKPLRMLKAVQRKGLGPGLAVLPGAGIMARFATAGAEANNIGTILQLQEIIDHGVSYFSTHPEDLNNPAFRFDAKNLRLTTDRGMYDWFRNKTVEYNMGSIERIVRDAIARQQAGERTITTEMVEQLAQMNSQELDGASSINTAPAGLQQNKALQLAMPLLRWPLWMMHKAHEGLATTEGKQDFKSMMRGLGRLAAWNLPLGLAFTFLIDEYDEKILGKKNAMPNVSKWAAAPVIGVPLALATSPRDIPEEAINIGLRMIRAGNIYGLGGDLAGAFIAPFDPGSGQRSFSLDQRVLVMSQLQNLFQAISNMVSQGGTATWGSVYRPLVTSVGGNGMLNSLDVVNNMLGLDNAEARLTTRINAARWVNTAAKELEIETKKSSGFSAPTPMSVWTREMQLAAMANSRADFMSAYQKALDAAREKVGEDDRINPENREKEAVARVLASWRARNPFSGLATTATPDQIRSMLGVMNEQGRRDVQDAMRYYDAYTALIKPSEMDQFLNRRMQAANPMRQIESLRRRAAGMMMASP